MNDELKLDFSKGPDGLLPAIVQDSISGQVLMLGYMNLEAFDQTKKTGKVTFFSRSKNRLWVKGESSGNYLDLVSMATDCDQDAILIQAKPHGPTCHTGRASCFTLDTGSLSGILGRLENLLTDRKANPRPGSYSSKLFSEDISRIAQKVGEEGVEVALASVVASEQELIGEMADLWFHSLVLLTKKDIPLSKILEELVNRNLIKEARPRV